MTPSLLMSTRIDRRRLVVGSSGMVIAAPLLARSGSVTAQDGSNVSVTMVTDTAGIGDQNFNDLAAAGGERSAAELGVEFNILESQTAADYIPNLTQAAESSDLTVAVGALLTEAVEATAPMFPDSYFALIDGAVEEPNVLSILFREQEGGFLGGVLAGLATQTGILGIVGGIRVPPVGRYEVGFVAGARSVNPSIQILISYADSFEDPALGQELTLAQFNQGADIVFPIAGRTGVGSFDAAVELGPGHWILAADADQSHLGPGQQIAAIQKGIDTAFFNAVSQVVNGTFEGGVLSLGLAEGGMDIIAIDPSVSQDIIATVEAYKQAIIDGTIVPPVNDEELEAFQPVSPEELGAPATPAASPAASPAA